MKYDRLKIRRWIMVVLTLAVFGIFVARLMDIQIVRSDEIRAQLEAETISKQVVKATRGEIVDRNGVSLVSNRLGYDVVIDKVYFPKNSQKASQNGIILELIHLFEECDMTWNDNLPLTADAPFAFLPGFDTEVERLKKDLKIQPYASAEEAMYWLIENYALEDFSPSDARKIAGVRYEMQRRDFSNDFPYTFASDINIDLVLRIKERSHALLGVEVVESAIRSYDMGDIAPHLIGRIGPIYAEEYADLKTKGYAMDDIVGKSGVESAFETFLRGKNGTRVITIDAGEKVVGEQETDAPIPGNTIVLTIDADLQRIAQRALEAQIKHLQQTAPAGQGREADVGAVVAINNKTGQILACATYPSYSQDTFLQDYGALLADEQRPLLNRALQGLYEPGSIFKPVVGTAGLATGAVTEDSTVHCGMVYTRFKDYQPKCLSAHGNINIIRALSVSCNIYFYDTGWKTGIENIDKYAKAYGLGEETGIELYEEQGYRSNPEAAKALGNKWNDGDVLQSSIGQLYQRYTPLQLANYVATIANRGKRMDVTIVNEIQDYSRQQAIQPAVPQVAATVDASAAVYDTIVRGMVAASRSGSARQHFGSYPFDVASKTGTPEGGGELPNSTFICFGPADNPEIAIAVVIEKGWHGYTGAPVAKAIMDEYFGIQSPNPLLPRVEPDAADTTAADVSVPDSTAQGASAAGASTADSSAESADTSGASAPNTTAPAASQAADGTAPLPAENSISRASSDSSGVAVA